MISFNTFVKYYKVQISVNYYQLIAKLHHNFYLSIGAVITKCTPQICLEFEAIIDRINHAEII